MLVVIWKLLVSTQMKRNEKIENYEFIQMWNFELKFKKKMLNTFFEIMVFSL